MRFSASIDAFHLLPPASQSYSKYADALIQIAKAESATLFIPVSGAGSSVEDARAAETMSTETKGRCRTFIQDPGTMLDLHDKDRFMALVDKLGFTIPSGKMIEGVDEGIEYLRGVGKKKFVLKCMGLDENRGDMTLFPVSGDGKDLGKTRKVLAGLNTKITKECPYVFQEYVPGPGAYLPSSPPVPHPLYHLSIYPPDPSHPRTPHRLLIVSVSTSALSSPCPTSVYLCAINGANPRMVHPRLGHQRPTHLIRRMPLKRHVDDIRERNLRIHRKEGRRMDHQILGSIIKRQISRQRPSTHWTLFIRLYHPFSEWGVVSD